MKPPKIIQCLFVLPLLVCLCITNDLKAVSAFPADLIFKQPDGSSFVAKLKGDEWFNWVETRDNRIIVRNKATGFYEYGIIIKKDDIESLSPSGVIVREEDMDSPAETLQLKPISQSDLKRMSRHAHEKRRKLPKKQP